MKQHTTVGLEDDALKAVKRFAAWLDGYGEFSYDFQTFLCKPHRAKR